MYRGGGGGGGVHQFRKYSWKKTIFLVLLLYNCTWSGKPCKMHLVLVNPDLGVQGKQHWPHPMYASSTSDLENNINQTYFYHFWWYSWLCCLPTFLLASFLKRADMWSASLRIGERNQTEKSEGATQDKLVLLSSGGGQQVLQLAWNSSQVDLA